MLPAFLINLDRSTDRLAFMRQQTARAGVAFERVSAVVGDAVPKWLWPQFIGPHQLTPGEIGCYASHLVVAKQIVDRDLPCAIVLEDDAILDLDFMAAAQAAAQAAPAGWDYIHLCSDFKRSVVSVAEIANGRHVVQYTRWPVNTAAYIVSAQGAKKWLEPRSRVRPNDMDNRYCWLQGLDVYGVYPAPAKQSNDFESDVGHRPGKKEVRNWSPGFASEVYGQIWTARKIGIGSYLKARCANIANSIARKFTGKRVVSVIKRGTQ